MKHLLFVAGLALAVSMPLQAADEAPKTKRACVTQKDPKTGKDKEVCKEIKIHKKHEGTKPEDVKKTDPKKADTKPADQKKAEQKK
jgi:basic membrane lipoprotein Med (substrate-binding protein (PBP1-ABC) superfamily)